MNILLLVVGFLIIITSFEETMRKSKNSFEKALRGSVAILEGKFRRKLMLLYIGNTMVYTLVFYGIAAYGNSFSNDILAYLLGVAVLLELVILIARMVVLTDSRNWREYVKTATALEGSTQFKFINLYQALLLVVIYIPFAIGVFKS